LAVLLTATGCQKQQMADQPRYEAYERSTFFADSLAARPVEEGTVDRTGPPPGASYTRATESGSGGDSLGAAFEGQLKRRLPFPVSMEMLERGQQQFNVYCAPCHGRVGTGQGMVAMRGLRRPPSYHTERLRNAPIGHFFEVITNGYGAMYSYAARVKPEDRWAIAAYIRALQLSQNAGPQDLPPDRRGELGFIASDSLQMGP
jgi:mono/diheme cytochrome c family protein